MYIICYIVHSVLVLCIIYLCCTFHHNNPSQIVYFQTSLEHARSGSPTPVTRQWYWRTSSWTTHTSRGRSVGRSRASCTSPSAKSKSGFKTAVWSARSSTSGQSHCWRMMFLLTNKVAPSLEVPNRCRVALLPRPMASMLSTHEWNMPTTWWVAGLSSWRNQDRDEEQWLSGNPKSEL